MTTFVAAIALALALGFVLLVLERNYRRTERLPHAPLGADVEADADLEHVLHDLQAAKH